ncbi:hypothetical protein R1sor_010270 [Riccia sorocarpa]|uniref:Uncharacterized protein n=1 Tax=Riccia sorocarpa TaxID=122646 RepID=A0ABD3I0X2_9MARC
MRRLTLACKPIYVTPFLYYLYKAHGWLEPDEERRHGKPDTFVEEIIASDKETTAEESTTPPRILTKRIIPKTSVAACRTKTQVQKRTIVERIACRDDLDFESDTSNTRLDIEKDDPLPKRKAVVRKRTSAVSPMKKPEQKRVRHLELDPSPSDEDNRNVGPSHTSAPGFKFGVQTDEENLQQLEQRQPKTLVFFNVNGVFAVAQRVLNRLSTLARE